MDGTLGGQRESGIGRRWVTKAVEWALAQHGTQQAAHIRTLDVGGW
jgi:hypothetical protein